jgi:hypothetical protein
MDAWVSSLPTGLLIRLPAHHATVEEAVERLGGVAALRSAVLDPLPSLFLREDDDGVTPGTREDLSGLTFLARAVSPSKGHKRLRPGDTVDAGDLQLARVPHQVVFSTPRGLTLPSLWRPPAMTAELLLQAVLSSRTPSLATNLMDSELVELQKAPREAWEAVLQALTQSKTQDPDPRATVMAWVRSSTEHSILTRHRLPELVWPGGLLNVSGSLSKLKPGDYSASVGPEELLEGFAGDREMQLLISTLLGLFRARPAWPRSLIKTHLLSASYDSVMAAVDPLVEHLLGGPFSDSLKLRSFDLEEDAACASFQTLRVFFREPQSSTEAQKPATKIRTVALVDAFQSLEARADFPPWFVHEGSLRLRSLLYAANAHSWLDPLPELSPPASEAELGALVGEGLLSALRVSSPAAFAGVASRVEASSWLGDSVGWVAGPTLKALQRRLALSA